MVRVPIDEIRLHKINEGFPHAEVYAAGYFCGSKVTAAMGRMSSTVEGGLTDALRVLCEKAILIYPTGNLTARGNVKVVVD